MYVSCLFLKSLPSHFTWALLWNKSSLLILFWNLPWYSLFLHRKSTQRTVNTLLMIKINPRSGNYSFLFVRKKKTWSWHNSSSIPMLIFASKQNVSEALALYSQQQKLIKTTWKSFSLSSSQKPFLHKSHFLLPDCIVCKGKIWTTACHYYFFKLCS